MTLGKEVTTLKNFFTTRRNYLLTNAEVSQAAPVIAEANLYSVAGGQNLLQVKHLMWPLLSLLPQVLPA
jgi:hypothetical protein